MVGLSYLFDLNFQLLLSFCVMVPTAYRLRKSKGGVPIPSLDMMDFCLLAYCILTSFLFLHFEITRGVLVSPTFTDCLRRCFESIFGNYVPYFVISRSNVQRVKIHDTLMAFCISCGLLAAIAIFEGARHWLLYGEVLSRWGSFHNSYTLRGESVRAMASTGHSLSLGYLLAIAFGIWLYLQSKVESKRLRLAVTALFVFGLLAAYSRGPWLGAVLIYFAYAALSPRAFTGLFKAAGISAIGALIVALSPLGDKIAKVMPFLGGTIDVSNIDYRHRLLGRTWQIIRENPIFGDQNALLKMEDLRQGEGIIDLMNGFAHILLSNGFLGLSLFLSFILIGVFKAWALSRKAAKIDAQLSMLGASLISCILGTLLMMWGGGLIELMTCVLVGLTAAYVHLGQAQQSNPTLSKQGSGIA